MIKLLNKAIRKISKLVPLLSKKEIDMEIIEWKKNGRPVPPPHIIKQQTIRDYASRFDLKVLIETGTFLGDMVEAMKGHFNEIYSIELGGELHEKAKIRFSGEDSIKLILGDSGVELENIVNILDQPALFWLDGHYSMGVTAQGDKDTPIYEELTHIFNSKEFDHVIIIDDARCFGTEPTYPSIEEIKDFIMSKRPRADIEIKDDSIRIVQNSKLKPEFDKFFSDKAESKRYDYPSLDKDSKVMDIGAFEGDFAKGIIKKYGCWVHSYEPVPAFYENIASSRHSDKHIVHNFGLSGKAEVKQISLNSDASSANISINKQHVDCKFEDILCELDKFDSVDLIKINIEGDEFPLLERLIESEENLKKVKNIQVQFHDFIDNCEERRKYIVKKLSKTHEQTWCYYFVWENWCLKK